MQNPSIPILAIAVRLNFVRARNRPQCADNDHEQRERQQRKQRELDDVTDVHVNLK